METENSGGKTAMEWPRTWKEGGFFSDLSNKEKELP
jgi:hypothetical protein